HVRIARMLDAEPLERTEVIGVPEIAAQLFEDLPVSPLTVLAERGNQMAPQILRDRVVVEQRIVDVEQIHDRVQPESRTANPESRAKPHPASDSCPPSRRVPLRRCSR